MFHSTKESPVAYYFIYTLAYVRVDLKQHPNSCSTVDTVPVWVARSEFSTRNLRYKHSNTCLHVSFHPGKSCCILFYIYTGMRTCVDLKQHFIQHYCPRTCVCSYKLIFDHKFTVQTFKYLLACLIQSRKVLLHIILYIHLHAYVCRLKAAFHTILLSLYLCV